MFDVVIPYIHTQDCGMELRYSLRSLKNITNFSGKVWVIGDRELWFSPKINYINVPMIKHKPYYDQVNKMLSIINELPSDFIASQDDLYITSPTEIIAYKRGELTGIGDGYHNRTKRYTAEVLSELGYENLLDFECHTPMLVNKHKFEQTLNMIADHPRKELLQWRSLYGNMHDLYGIPFEDAKTKTSHLKDGYIISTNFYTTELDKLFPEKSEFEL